MTTKKMLKQIMNSFNVNQRWLERFFNIKHATFCRYLSGETEARLSNVHNWLSKLKLCILGDKIHFYHFGKLSDQSIDSLPKWYLSTKLDSILDDIEWKAIGEKEEQKEGHRIFWTNK
jgi:hypothetical protein